MPTPASDAEALEVRVAAAEQRVLKQEKQLLELKTTIEGLEIAYKAGEQINQGLHRMVDELADQLAWFRREHTVVDPLMAAFRMVRNGRMTNISFLEFTNSKAVDKFLQYRDPSVAPHLSNEDVMRELAEARKRLGFTVEGE